MAHPDHALWKAGWRANRIPFHLTHVHPLLERFWPQLGLAATAPVFVPLCGKSLDIAWLHERGHPVSGIELSEVAVKALFEAAGRPPQRRAAGELTCWTHAGLDIYCGDFFALTADDLRGIRAVYDRAALTALPENLRADYVAHLHAILPADCQILLLTVEDLDADEAAADNMQQSAEIAALYALYFSLELLHAELHETDGERSIDKAYRLQRSHHPTTPWSA